MVEGELCTISTAGSETGVDMPWSSTIYLVDSVQFHFTMHKHVKQILSSWGEKVNQKDRMKPVSILRLHPPLPKNILYKWQYTHPVA